MRELIFKIHTRSLTVAENIDLKRFVNITEGATGADIKAICTEAGMFAIRKEAENIINKDFFDAIDKVMKKIEDQFKESRLYS